MRNVIITALAATIITVSFNANARFSLEKEYKVMKDCVQNPWFFDRKVKICACAIGENKYSYDSAYEKNKSRFIDALEKNIDICKKYY
jgi:hypothetical protein